MITRIGKLLCRGLARAERFVEPRSEPSDQGADQHDLDRETRILWNQVRSRTMTSIYRIDALRQAVEYIEAKLNSGRYRGMWSMAWRVNDGSGSDAFKAWCQTLAVAL
jgi:hypothetical protein